jgi:uncharacterized protein YecE (DUF72 family)
VNLHVGTMGWSYGFWKPSFYPQKLPSKDLLSYYAQKFGTVEVDSSFYHIPKTQTLTQWKQQTPEGFLFSLKFPQRITHVNLLRDAEEATGIFLRNVGLLGEKLGVLLLQLPPLFRQTHFQNLKDYLPLLPKGYKYAVEIRNKSLLTAQVYSLLRDHNVALAWADTPKMPQPSEVTADFLYIRWEGDRKTVTGTLGKTEADRAGDIRLWGERLKPFLEAGKTVFGYFSKYYSGYPPSDISALLNFLQK